MVLEKNACCAFVPNSVYDRTKYDRTNVSILEELGIKQRLSTVIHTLMYTS